MSLIPASSLSGQVSLAVVHKLRLIEVNTKAGSQERALAALPVIAEFQDGLEQVLNCISLDGVLMMCRLGNPSIPSSNKLRAMNRTFRDRLRDEPGFMRRTIDVLPTIAYRYESANPIEVVGDPEFQSLLKN